MDLMKYQVRESRTTGETDEIATSALGSQQLTLAKLGLGRSVYTLGAQLVGSIGHASRALGVERGLGRARQLGRLA